MSIVSLDTESKDSRLISSSFHELYIVFMAISSDDDVLVNNDSPGLMQTLKNSKHVVLRCYIADKNSSISFLGHK